MADNSKKPSKTSGWVAVGDSMEGIKNLRPDVLKQKMDQLKAIDAHIKKHGVPASSSGTSTPMPVASNTGKSAPKGK
ncbi:hypothetical protein [Burkholderia pseudomallei]|uniref:hypothetical protein n=1 Tax=Burkholderia pseudomallei TaxID=28450 RepID=UPI0005EA1EA9|nr:hypothetical protein [Burkholderia pseudomallei]CAJ3336347.1 Uncharacterised protein [Burkholderia pseudomallei]CAJ3926684.1 Uncharacterised protein [Burkholderia pseudomallei]CAJ3978274.1 Uncharacterised protein [Burkholderia pseudomallei]CAJ5703037.1 Uncharacterised protein [Burkholderia pseudomallei]CAJ7177574.1 Uncharacterised protein [Burkholderia pseudomallei]